MADYGIKITYDGYNALVASPIDTLQFTSETFLFKSFASGNMTVSVPANGTGTGTVSHGLGYRPAVAAYWSYDQVSWHIAGHVDYTLSPVIVIVASSSTNITVNALNSSTATTVYVKWVAYVDSLG